MFIKVLGGEFCSKSENLRFIEFWWQCLIDVRCDILINSMNANYNSFAEKLRFKKLKLNERVSLSVYLIDSLLVDERRKDHVLHKWGKHDPDWLFIYGKTWIKILQVALWYGMGVRMFHCDIDWCWRGLLKKKSEHTTDPARPQADVSLGSLRWSRRRCWGWN